MSKVGVILTFSCFFLLLNVLVAPDMLCVRGSSLKAPLVLVAASPSFVESKRVGFYSISCAVLLAGAFFILLSIVATTHRQRVR